MQSMDEIYQKYARNVYKYLLSLCHDEEIAEELTQETFYQAIKCIDKYDYTCKLSTWLCAIAKRQYYEYVRKHPVHDVLEATECINKNHVSAEDECITELSKVDILKKMHELCEPFREIMYLRIYGNLSFKEIGEIMGKNENWARVNFYRGKEKLRKEIDENE